MRGNSNTNPFTQLSNRAVRGDDGAKAQLRRDLEPEVVRIVRRVVQTGAARSPLDRRILAEADRFGLDAASIVDIDGESLLRHVARSVCSIVVAATKPQTRDRCPLEDTVRS